MILFDTGTGTLALLSALWLIGFLLVWRLIRLRILTLEEKLATFGLQIDQMRRVTENRAQGAADDPGRIPRAAIAADITKLTETIEAVRETQNEQKIAYARALDLIERLAADLEEGRSERWVDRIKSRFTARGFQNIRVLGDLAGTNETGGPIRVPVEGQKGGVTYKGYVVLDSGQIVDEKLTSSHEAFP